LYDNTAVTTHNETWRFPPLPRACTCRSVGGAPILPLAVSDTIVLIELGAIVTDNPAWHGAHELYPLGYKAREAVWHEAARETAADRHKHTTASTTTTLPLHKLHGQGLTSATTTAIVGSSLAWKQPASISVAKEMWHTWFASLAALKQGPLGVGGEREGGRGGRGEKGQCEPSRVCRGGVKDCMCPSQAIQRVKARSQDRRGRCSIPTGPWMHALTLTPAQSVQAPVLRSAYLPLRRCLIIALLPLASPRPCVQALKRAPSMRSAAVSCDYLCEIVRGDDGRPSFRVTSLEDGMSKEAETPAMSVVASRRGRGGA